MTYALRIFLCLILVYPVFAHAQDQEAEAPKENSAVVAAKELSSQLDDISARHFNVIFSNHNLIRVVEAVRESISTAVKLCGEKNPDMKVEVDDAFAGWRSTVDPVLKEAEANVRNMILAQGYAKPREIRNVLKLIDKERKARDEEVEKVPVSSPEGCKQMVKTMSKTQVNMEKLLRSTLVSTPQKIQVQSEKEAAEKAAKDAKENAESGE